MHADIHDGPEQMLQSKAGYIDARPLTASSAKPLATHGRSIHWVTLGRSRSEHNEPALPQAADIEADSAVGPGRAKGRHRLGKTPLPRQVAISDNVLAGMAASDAANSLDSGDRLSGIANPEGQQDIAGSTAPLRVARIHVEHAVHNDWSGSVDRSPTRLNAIRRGVVARRVDRPKQP